MGDEERIVYVLRGPGHMNGYAFTSEAAARAWLDQPYITSDSYRLEAVRQRRDPNPCECCGQHHWRKVERP